MTSLLHTALWLTDSGPIQSCTLYLSWLELECIQCIIGALPQLPEGVNPLCVLGVIARIPLLLRK